MEQKRFPVFAERFAKLRGEMTQGEFAEFLGISRPTVGFYENGTRIPDALVLRQIAERCDVSVDWLIGLSDAKSAQLDVQTAVRLTGLSENAIQWISGINSQLTTGEELSQQLLFELSSLIANGNFAKVLVELAKLRILVEAKNNQQHTDSFSDLADVINHVDHAKDEINQYANGLFYVVQTDDYINTIRLNLNIAFNSAVESIMKNK